MKTRSLQSILNNAAAYRFMRHQDGRVRLIADTIDTASLNLSPRGSIPEISPLNAGAYEGPEADKLHQQFSAAIEEYEPSQMIIPAWRTFLATMEQYTMGLTVNAVQLNLMGKGLDAGKIRISRSDRELINGKTVELQSADGSETAEASLWWIVQQLNLFASSTEPRRRGIIRSRHKYEGASKILALALSNRNYARSLIRSGLDAVPSIPFRGEHGQLVRKLLPEIGALALADGNTAYLRLLIRNSQPLSLKTQYLENVTAPEYGNAWQNRVRTHEGIEVTYAEMLRAAGEALSSESNLRYRCGVSTTLARLGMRIEVVDPQRTLDSLPKNFIAVSNHQSYVDIGAIATALVNIPHSFVAHDGLPPITLGIGSHLIGGNHTIIERTSRTMDGIKIQWLKDWTRAEYARTLQKGLSLFIFPQGTRSRQADWRDLKKTGDGILEKKYRSSANLLVDIAIEHGIKILPMHVVNTGKVFMPELIKGEMGDVLGMQAGFRHLLNLAQMPVFGTKHMGNIQVRVAPLLDPAKEKPEVIIDKLVNWHNENQAQGRV